jgi:hypothetical protein
VVHCSPATGETDLDLFDLMGIDVIKGKNKTIVDAYRSAVTYGCKKLAPDQSLLYTDFDRLVHWVMRFPEELAQIITSQLNNEFVLIGRTARAFNTHPETQRSTEQLANTFGSQILNVAKTIDLVSACWMAKKPLIEKGLSFETTTSRGFYAMWPIHFWTLAKIPHYVEVEGMEWETPDRYQKEITELGYDHWLEQFQTSDEWKRRVGLLTEMLSEYNRIASFTLKK